MAHEIEYRDGRHNFFEVGAERSAWHRLGQLLTKAPESIEEAVQLIGADYPIAKRATTYLHTNPDGTTEQRESKLAFVTMRADTGRELGAVGPLYQPIQNVDAFRATIGPLVDSKVLTLETGAVLRDGGTAFLLGRLNFDHFGPVASEFFAKEGIQPYVGVSTDHTGKRGNILALTTIRWVCANTLGMDEVNAARADAGAGADKFQTIRHLGDAHAKHIEAAERLLGGMVQKAEAIARSYQLLKQTELDEQLFRALALIPVIGIHPTRRSEFNPEAKLANNMVERYEERVKSIEWLWEHGKGHVGDRSAWEAYNGVVEAIDHNEKLFPARSGVYRLGALLAGDLRAKKDAARNRLNAYALGTLDGIDDIASQGQLVTAK